MENNVIIIVSILVGILLLILAYVTYRLVTLKKSGKSFTLDNVKNALMGNEVTDTIPNNTDQVAP